MYFSLWKSASSHFLQTTPGRGEAHHSLWFMSDELKLRGAAGLPLLTWAAEVELKAVVLLAPPPAGCISWTGLQQDACGTHRNARRNSLPKLVAVMTTQLSARLRFTYWTLFFRNKDSSLVSDVLVYTLLLPTFFLILFSFYPSFFTIKLSGITFLKKVTLETNQGLREQLFCCTFQNCEQVKLGTQFFSFWRDTGKLCSSNFKILNTKHSFI